MDMVSEVPWEKKPYLNKRSIISDVVHTQLLLLYFVSRPAMPEGTKLVIRWCCLH